MTNLTPEQRARLESLASRTDTPWVTISLQQVKDVAALLADHARLSADLEAAQGALAWMRGIDRRAAGKRLTLTLSTVDITELRAALAALPAPPQGAETGDADGR